MNIFFGILHLKENKYRFVKLENKYRFGVINKKMTISNCQPVQQVPLKR